MSLIPQSIIRDRWLRTLSGLTHGTLFFTGPDGREIVHEGALAGPKAHFVVHDWNVLQRAASRGDIGLAEDYIAGKCETDDVETLIAYFLRNFDDVEDYANGSFLNRLFFSLRNSVLRRNSLRGSKRNIEAHYDVGNDFYRLWLDETMTYSSALFRTDEDTLCGAQHNKYDRILSRLGNAGDNLLEIGCGWGGFAEEASRSGRSVTGLTISPAQYAFASERLSDKADIRLEDYRETSGRFDAVVSIEMFEAVGQRYWPQYFSVLAERLRAGGRAIVQTITIRDELFDGYSKRSDFIRHYVFPGGLLPSLARFKEEASRAGFRVADVFTFGEHYARTLREWSGRLRASEGDILALGRDRAFLRNWEFYLGMCAAAFAVGRTDVAQIELLHA